MKEVRIPERKVLQVDGRTNITYIRFVLEEAGFDFTRPYSRYIDLVTQDYVYLQEEENETDV